MRRTRNYVRALFLRLTNPSHVAAARTMCHIGRKTARPFITLSSEHKWGLTLTEPVFVAALTPRLEEARAMGRSCQFHRFLELQPPGVEHHQQTNWKVWTLLSFRLHLSKLHRLITRKKWDTQDKRPQVHNTHQQGGLRHREGSKFWGL